MRKADLCEIYRKYIVRLNEQNWPKVERFVHEEVSHNGRALGIAGYREMLRRDLRENPNLYFEIALLICDPPYIASRLTFDCTPKKTFLGLDVNGKRIAFSEYVFYEFESQKMFKVWSVIDKAAIEAQL